MSARALVLALAVAAALPQPDAVQAKNEPKSAQTQQRGSDSLPVTVKLLNTGESEEQAKRDSAGKERESRLTESLVTWTKVLGVATIILAAFTVGLWWVTKGTLAHLRNEFQAEHRPWVAIRKVNTPDEVNWTDQGASLIVDFALQNTGRTPAIAAWPTGTIFPFFYTGAEESPDDHTRFWDEASKRRRSSDVIGPTIAPGQKLDQRNTLRMSAADVEAYRSWYGNQEGVCKLMIVGAVGYQSRLDIVEHHTGFVWELWTGRAESPEPISRSGQFVPVRVSRSVFGPGVTD